MHAVPHSVGFQGFEDGTFDFVARRHFGECHCVGGVEQAVEMGVEIGDPPAVDPQALPNSVTTLDGAIEDRDFRFGARF